MDFAQFLRKERMRMGLTQEELAKKIHVSKSAIAKWESGRGIPDRSNLRQLAKTMGVSIDALNKICEGNEADFPFEIIVNELIEVLEKYGYKITKNT